ncbi:MAG: type II toxin-antitoxin system HipA family toxin [Lachnospiraceae bacterium]|nr:type II toxin-antitoxin system HipA family toxin [Lachnospiraceae bacterium]
MIGAGVYLWGTKIGTVAQEDSAHAAVFTYERDFLQSGIEVSPIWMPLSARNYSFPGLRPESFHGLPGMLADSLPDRYGTKLLEMGFAKRGRAPENILATERLCYTGTRGMGALEYRPESDLVTTKDESLDLDVLVQAASEVLSEREELRASETDLHQLISVGTSAGGARAKAIIAWNRKTGDVRSGQTKSRPGYEHWIVKFDGVAGNRDHGDRDDGEEFTRIEYAYHLMAVAAGIEMTECVQMRQSGRYHFATKRFDRVGETGEKLHMQTLGGLAHYDFNDPGTNSYEQAAQVIYRLGMGKKEIEQLYRRMVFNVLARNQDDHVKNISFLMDRRGQWSLAPAYDITFALDPTNRWLRRHQMSVNGKLDAITAEDLIAAGRNMNLLSSRAKRIANEVAAVLSDWPTFAEQASVTEATMETIRGLFVTI